MREKSREILNTFELEKGEVNKVEPLIKFFRLYKPKEENCDLQDTSFKRENSLKTKILKDTSQN